MCLDFANEENTGLIDCDTAVSQFEYVCYVGGISTVS